MSFLNKNIVLVLNRNWQAISTVTPAQAFSRMASDSSTGLDVQTPGFMTPVDWETWIKLPVRDKDIGIGTTKSPIRVPTVVVLSRYSDVPIHRPKFSFKNLWMRDNGRCQYTGRELRHGEGNIDHVIPSSRGGPTTWDNCVLSCRKINTFKADRTPEEAGLTLLRQPEEPIGIPTTLTLSNIFKIPDWKKFLPHAS